MEKRSALRQAFNRSAKKAERIDIECVVRGYLAGSGWASINGAAPSRNSRFKRACARRIVFQAVFTPAMKNDAGHGKTFDQASSQHHRCGSRNKAGGHQSPALFIAAGHAQRCGIILADTKFEFGFVDGELTLIDEALTPDSSRFWDARTYDPVMINRASANSSCDWLIDSGWDKEATGA
ncbi:MAG: phosphoribosylaminoimidazolesuccinocarboxamide synthase [Thermomicrobiales bacterium]